jgi:predicted secreted protein
MAYTGGYPGVSLGTVRARYSFAVDGGAVGTIDLTSSAQIPKGAVIISGFVEVDTVPTSGGSATLAIKVEGAGDIVSGAISGSPWSTTGPKNVAPGVVGAAPVKTTVARKVQATIGVAALTAGVVDVVLVYVEMPD